MQYTGIQRFANITRSKKMFVKRQRLLKDIYGNKHQCLLKTGVCFEERIALYILLTPLKTLNEVCNVMTVSVCVIRGGPT